MSLAYYINTDPADEEVISAVDGKLLANVADQLNELARGLGLPDLESFLGTGNELLDALGLDGEFVGATEGASESDDQAESWWDADEGIEWFSMLMPEVADHADQFDDADDLQAELDEFLQALKLAKKRGERWQLVMDF